MTNLFSIFDPQSFLSLPLNWLSSLLVLFLLPTIFWVSPNQMKLLTKSALSFVHLEFKAIFGVSSSPGMTLIMVSFFSFLLLNNLLGLTPYIFTASSHLSFTFALATPLWLGHMIYAWLKSPTPMLAHLVPLGTPALLMPLMVIIETVSNLIRPLTLSVRLAANMVAGHLLLTLLGSQGPNLSFTLFLPLLTGLLLLGTLECAVAMIQSYVFSVLSALYVNEVNSSQLIS